MTLSNGTSLRLATGRKAPSAADSKARRDAKSAAPRRGRRFQKEGEAVARKPNYQFERKERERSKAAKAAEKAAAKQRERDEAANAETPTVTPPKAED
jgi:hypothetical protein